MPSFICSVGMEGIKSDRPLWINKILKQFADDIKYGKDPTVNIRKQYNMMESGQVALEELLIKLILQKDLENYPKNRLQRVVGTELQSFEGGMISYYKSDIVVGGGTSNANLISIRKYLEMIRTTVHESLKVIGYDYEREILGQQKLKEQ